MTWVMVARKGETSTNLRLFIKFADIVWQFIKATKIFILFQLCPAAMTSSQDVQQDKIIFKSHYSHV